MSLLKRLAARLASSTPNVPDADLLAVVKVMIVAMYQDRHIGAEEMDQIQKFMQVNGMTGGRFADLLLPAAIAEVRRSITPGADNAPYIRALCQSIGSADARLLAIGACNDLIRSDRTVTDGERAVLQAVIEALDAK